MRSFGRWTFAVASAVVALGITAARGHDLQGLVGERKTIEPEAWAKIEEIRKLRRFLASESSKTQDGELKAVVKREMTWPDGRVSACFLDGGPEARDHVAEVAQRWMEATSLKFDFGPAGNRNSCDAASPSNVRVSFFGLGYWSYVGTEARQAGPKQQTLGLQGMDKASFTTEDDGVILHEFGHAIGFEHEHQSPVSVCEKEFNWDSLYKTMGALGWGKEMVDTNMRQIQPSSKLLTSSFDPESVMLYSLDKAVFRDPSTAKCYIPNPNNVISRADREAAATAYPLVVGSLDQPMMRSVQPPRTRDAAVVSALRRLKELTESPRR